jgi:putative transposase
MFTEGHCFPALYGIQLNPKLPSKLRKLRDNELDIHTQKHYTKITKEGKKYYLHLLVDCIPSRKRRSGTVALDPGVRTFLTSYSTNRVDAFGDHCLKKIEKINERIDRSKSKSLKQFLYQKKTNVVKGLHIETANYLVNFYSNILYPTFETSKMLSGDQLRSSSKRTLQDLSFYKFKTRLHWMCFKIYSL